MAWLQTLRNRFYAWAISRAVIYGFQELASAKLGEKLNRVMDDQWGADRSNVMQKEVAAWLRQVAKELET